MYKQLVQGICRLLSVENNTYMVYDSVRVVASTRFGLPDDYDKYKRVIDFTISYDKDYTFVIASHDDCTKILKEGILLGGAPCTLLLIPEDNRNYTDMQDTANLAFTLILKILSKIPIVPKDKNTTIMEDPNTVNVVSFYSMYIVFMDIMISLFFDEDNDDDIKQSISNAIRNWNDQVSKEINGDHDLSNIAFNAVKGSSEIIINHIDRLFDLVKAYGVEELLDNCHIISDFDTIKPEVEEMIESTIEQSSIGTLQSIFGIRSFG